VEVLAVRRTYRFVLKFRSPHYGTPDLVASSKSYGYQEISAACPRVKAGSNTSTVSQRVVEGEEEWTQCLGVKLALQVGGGGWDAGLTILLCKKKILLRNPKMWKPDQIWQNLLSKAKAQKGLLCCCWWWRWWWLSSCMNSRYLLSLWSLRETAGVVCILAAVVSIAAMRHQYWAQHK
jgi:hypothetical protein